MAFLQSTTCGLLESSDPRQAGTPKPWPLNEIEEPPVLQEAVKLGCPVAAELSSWKSTEYQIPFLRSKT